MKRTIISCLMAVGLWLTATAANTVILTSAQGHPGDEVEIAVMLTITDEVTAIELLVPLGDKLSYVEGSAVINAERANGHTLSAAEQDGKLSMVIFSPTLATLKGVDGELCRFKLKLGKEPADYTLTPDVVMSDASGNALTCSVESGVVTLLSPKIEVTTPTIDYGRVPIRSSYTKTMTIRNSGNEPLEITDIVFDNADLSASSVPCTIAAGSVSNFALTYAPQQRGTVTSNVTIASNAINPKAGKAVVKALPYSVNELHVQRAEGISDEEVTVVLKMNNMEPIAGAQCEFTLPDALKYVEGSAAVGGRCEATDHKVSGVVQGKVLTLFMYSPTNKALPEGDGELMTFRVRLDGQSGSYRLDPKEVVLSNIAMGNMTSATSGNYVVVKSPKFSGANALDMGDIPVTLQSTATYSIYNSSQVPLVINKVTFLAEGYTIEDELPLTIEPWQTKALTVAYTPTKEGAYKTTMQIYTNDPTNRMHSVAVSGKVYEPNHITINGDNTQSGYRFVFGMDNYTEIVAIQMNIKWLPGMSASTATLTPTNRLKNHAYLVTNMGNGAYQVLIYSMANIPIEGNSGELFAIDYAAAEGTSYQNTELCVTDIVLSDAKGNNYVSGDEVKAKAAFSNFTLRFVVEGETISEQFVKQGTAITAPEMPSREGHSFAWTGLSETMPSNNLTVTGTYIVNNYSVIYKVDGEVYKTESIAYGTELTAIEAPTKEGYTFSGWSEFPETMPAGDVVITGSFTVNSYFVIYKVDGEVYKTESIAYGTELTAIEAPTKEGHTFSGWSELPETMPAEDVVITGSFTVNSYSVIYEVDGEVYRTESIAYGTELTAIEAPTKEGYTFSGWSELPETMPAGDVVITGSFTVNSYSVLYKVDGEAYRTETVAYGTELVAIEAPTKEGHTFGGWSELPETMPAGDVVVTGSFTVNSYSVIYEVDGEVYRTESIAYGTELTAIEAPTKEGYTFSGWSELPETMPAGDVMITGSFTVNEYKIIYMIDGVEHHEASIAYGTELTAIEAPTKEGYTFSGWSEFPETMPAGDVVITGSFTVNSYFVIYKVDGEVYKTESIAYGTELTAIEAPTKEGYTFSGWSEFPETMPAGDVVITGSFTVNSYSVIYEVDGEVYRTESIAYGTELTAIEAPTKEGYTFSGWSELPETMPAGDVVITGSFTVNEYKITYMIDGVEHHEASIAYGTELTAIEAPTKEGYTFSGWSEFPETMPAGDVVITGSFTVNSYFVIYKVDGEVYKTESIAYGTELTAIEAPTKEGYTFSGWSELPETMPAEDVVVSGYFTINIYKVYYYVGEELVHIAEVAYGEEIPEYIYEPKEGEGEFLGWVGDDYETMPAHEVYFTAEFGEIDTDIRQLLLKGSELVIYDLSGRKIQVGCLRELTTGVYIINGKKVVIR